MPKDLKPSRRKLRKDGTTKTNSIANAEKRANSRDVSWGKYTPAYCELVVRMGSEGASETEIAVYGCNVVRGTIRKWAKAHPEFKEALDFALECSQAWWENKARRNLRTQGFNTNLWNKVASSRFRNDYGNHLQLAGDADNPLQMNISKIVRRIVDPQEGGE